MAEIALQIENLSKVYRLGTIGTGSVRQDLTRWWTTSILKKEDPFFHPPTLDESGHTQNGLQAFWALQDLNFEVKQGEVLGIIGSNGAGKSTLLKIVSRIVKPSKGAVRGNGKLASLLEVGTGFHHELSGRENIFISGYVLGMKKEEIRRKFDEIVAFSGIEKFIDTPVKRYSSGMYVRLAFAVAAHLEPDILIVDEVLAVGDSQFQKRCLGKMQEVSQQQGRTILFVSHSMQAVQSLCNKALWLHHGKMKGIGEVSEIVNKYISSVQKFKFKQTWTLPEEGPGNDLVRFKHIELIPHLDNPDDPLDIRVPLTVKFQLWNLADDVPLSIGFLLYAYSGECIFDVNSPEISCQKGLVEGECTIPGNFLNDGSYYVSLTVVKDTCIPLYKFEECLSFDLEDFRGNVKWYGKWMGAVRPKFPFRLVQSERVLQS
jgi:lipopolysaccharide transport system ATP-binding protein